MSLPPDQLVTDLKRFTAPSYPDMDIRVLSWEGDPGRLAIHFTDPSFALLYPYQRWHYLTHLIPSDYYAAHLENTVWFELAPGEEPDDLSYPDEDLIDEITPGVMRCLTGAGFFQSLDDLMCPQPAGDERARCRGDFRTSRPVLLTLGFKEDELFDVFHVLMRQGGFCDCEILYNVAEQSRLKAEYWIARSEGRTPDDPHRA